jgi:hypothetical protein
MTVFTISGMIVQFSLKYANVMVMETALLCNVCKEPMFMKVFLDLEVFCFLEPRKNA